MLEVELSLAKVLRGSMLFPFYTTVFCFYMCVLFVVSMIGFGATLVEVWFGDKHRNLRQHEERGFFLIFKIGGETKVFQESSVPFG